MKSVSLTEELKNLIGAQELTIVNNSEGHPVLIVLPLSNRLQNICQSHNGRHELESLTDNWWQEIEQRFNPDNPSLIPNNTSEDSSNRAGDNELSRAPEDTTSHSDVPNPSENQEPDQPKIELGMVEVSIAIAGIAIGIATIIQNTTNSGDPTSILKLVIAIFSAVLAIFPSYAALDLLARYEIGEKLPPMQRIKHLFFKTDAPYWLVSITLAILLIFSSLIGCILIFVS